MGRYLAKGIRIKIAIKRNLIGLLELRRGNLELKLLPKKILQKLKQIKMLF